MKLRWGETRSLVPKLKLGCYRVLLWYRCISTKKAHKSFKSWQIKIFQFPCIYFLQYIFLNKSLSFLLIFWIQNKIKLVCSTGTAKAARAVWVRSPWLKHWAWEVGVWSHGPRESIPEQGRCGPVMAWCRRYHGARLSLTLHQPEAPLGSLSRAAECWPLIPAGRRYGWCYSEGTCYRRPVDVMWVASLIPFQVSAALFSERTCFVFNAPSLVLYEYVKSRICDLRFLVWWLGFVARSCKSLIFIFMFISVLVVERSVLFTSNY